MLLGIVERSRIDDVELDVVATELEVGADERSQLLLVLFAFQQSGYKADVACFVSMKKRSRRKNENARLICWNWHLVPSDRLPRLHRAFPSVALDEEIFSSITYG